VTTAATFQIEYLRYLDERGGVVSALPAFAADPAALLRFYEAMVLMRTYDAKAIALQRTGQLGTYASMLGKEAVDAGIGLAMRPEDVLLPTYRDNGIQMLSGVTLPAPGNCQRCFSSPTTSGQFQCRVRRKARPKRWRRKPSPPACPACRSTATT
jgi:TPP-dependent pyruvate/acetoin dehydrogenase alpha subunit